MNVKAWALSAFILTPQALDPIWVENLNLQFKDSTGSATVARASFVLEDQNWQFENATFEVYQQAGTLVIAAPEQGFEYRLEADFMKDVTEAQGQGVFADYGPGRVIARASSLLLRRGKDLTTLSRPNLSCRATARNAHPIDHCVASGRLTLNSFGGSMVEERSTSVSEIDVAITRGKTTFSARVGGVGKITGTGTTTHHADASEVRIRVDRVRLGILDITGQFFSQIKDLESDSIRIQRPNIIVRYAKDVP